MAAILAGFVLSELLLASPAAADVTQIPDIGIINGVACSSHTQCLGVGQLGTAPLAPKTGALSNGQSVQTIPGVSLNAVACPSATTCLAVGETDSASAGVAVSIDPATGDISNGETPQYFTGNLLLSVACTTPTQCLAVGFGAGRLGIAAPLNPNTGALPNGKDVQIVSGTGGAGLQGVACPTATRCVAVGENSDQSAGVAVSLNPGTGKISSGRSVQDVTSKGVLFGIGCSSSTHCLAVGWAADGPSVSVPLNPATGTVSDGQHDHSIWGPGQPDYLQLDAVACASTTQCVAAGDNAGDPSEGESVSLNAVTGRIPTGNVVQAVSGTSTLNSSVCPVTGRCLEAGSFAPSGAGAVVPVKPATGLPVGSSSRAH